MALHLNAFDLTTMGINNALTRVGKHAKMNTKRLSGEWVSEVGDIDETEMKVRG